MTDSVKNRGSHPVHASRPDNDPCKPAAPSCRPAPTCADGLDRAKNPIDQLGVETARLLATAARGGTVTVADLTRLGVAMAGSVKHGAGSFNPQLMRGQMLRALDQSLPPSTPPHVRAQLKAELNALIDQAPTARPLVLADGRRITAQDALRTLAHSLTLAAAAAKSQAPTGWVATPPTATTRPAAPAPNPTPATPPASAAAPPRPSAKAAVDSHSLHTPERKAKEGVIKASSHDDDAAIKVSRDPRALAVMTPAEKAAAIRELMDGYTSNTEDRAMLDILLSCKTREEFDAVMKMAGGHKVWKELDHGDTERKMLLLFQLWGRTDLIPANKRAWAAAIVPEGALMRADVGGLDSRGSDPASVDRKYGTKARDMNGLESQGLDRHLYADLDTATRALLMIEHGRRQHEGKPPLDYNKFLAELRGIMTDASLSGDARKQKIEQLRQKYDLTHDGMRELGTGRMASAMAETKADLVRVYQNEIGYWQQQLLYLDRTPDDDRDDSAEVQKIKERIKTFTADAEARLGRIDADVGELHSLYKVPASFWESFSDFVTDVAKVALKVLDIAAPLLNFIPGVGNAAYLAYVGVKTAIALANGDMLGVLAGVANLAGPLGGAVGGSLGTIIAKGGDLAKAGLTISRGADSLAKGDYVGALAGFGAGATGAGGALGMSASTIDSINKGVKVGTGIIRTTEGIASGDYEKALGGVLMATEGRLPSAQLNKILEKNPWMKETLDYTRQGIQLYNQIRTGDYAGALASLDRNLNAWAAGTSWEGLINESRKLPLKKLDEFLDENPRVRDLIKHGQTGVKIYNQIRSGDYLGALKTAEGLPWGDEVKALVDKAKKLQATALKELLEDNPRLRQLLDRREEAVKLYRQLREGDWDGALMTIGRELPDLLDGTRIGKLIDEGKRRLERPEVQAVFNRCEQFAPFVLAVINGDYQKGLDRLLEVPELASARKEIEEAREAVRSFAPTFRHLAAAILEQYRQLDAERDRTRLAA